MTDIRFGPLRLEEQDWYESWQMDSAVQTETQSPIEGDAGADAIAEAPTGLSVTVVTRERMGAVRAAELQSLLTTKQMLPVAVTSPGIDDNGYYVPSSDIRREDISSDGEDRSVSVPLTLTRAGTIGSAWSAIETTPVQVDHEFGNDLEPLIGVDAASTKRQWYDPETGARAPAGDPTDTIETEFGAVARYNTDDGETAVSTATPTLLYELEYSSTGVLDPVVWDSRPGAGYSESYGSDYGGVQSKFDADGVRQWQHVFATDHEFAGIPVLDNGLLRVYVRESLGDLIGEEWDNAAEEWQSVSLDWSSTDWALLDWDVETITPVLARSQATFSHPAEGLFALDAALERGHEAVRWSVPDGEEGPIPGELETVLEPIASERLFDAQPERTLVRRQEVRR